MDILDLNGSEIIVIVICGDIIIIILVVIKIIWSEVGVEVVDRPGAVDGKAEVA